jgi:fructose/tagatose bisphosphate aldolase
MPLVTERQPVLEIYAAAAARKWVVPTFNAENSTTVEAILTAHQDYADRIGMRRLPCGVGITNRYFHRAQSELYTHTRRWDIGLRRFCSDLRILTDPGAPFADLNVLVHLDHIQWDADAPLLEWNLNRFSSIMYDASTLPFEENIRRTAAFVQQRHRDLVVEGACDEVREATEATDHALTTPAMAERYARATGVDFMVANLGTEHRANAATLKYHGLLAREITQRVGPRLCLHGTSSVPPEQVRQLFADGVRKVNIWTALERDSTPALFEAMARNAAKVAGPVAAQHLRQAGVLGDQADLSSPPSLAHYTTTYRQDLVFQEMKRIVMGFLELWYA